MSKDTIYLYVDGSDLEDSEPELTAAFADLVKAWKDRCLLFVNDRVALGSTARPGDLPDWFLGVNVCADAITEDDIDSLLRFTKDLAGRTGHEFVFGLADKQRHISEDLCFISADSGDKERLIMTTALAKH